MYRYKTNHYKEFGIGIPQRRGFKLEWIGGQLAKQKKGASLFTSETAKLATQKKEEMKQERWEETEAEYGEGGLHIPIIINKHGVILDWHHRFRACKELVLLPNTTSWNSLLLKKSSS